MSLVRCFSLLFAILRCEKISGIFENKSKLSGRALLLAFSRVQTNLTQWQSSTKKSGKIIASLTSIIGALCFCLNQVAQGEDFPGEENQRSSFSGFPFRLRLMSQKFYSTHILTHSQICVGCHSFKSPLLSSEIQITCCPCALRSHIFTKLM